MRSRDGEMQEEIDDVRVILELEKSIIVEYENEEIVIPKSLVAQDSEVQGEGDEGTLIIPRWLARKMDMI